MTGRCSRERALPKDLFARAVCSLSYVIKSSSFEAMCSGDSILFLGRTGMRIFFAALGFERSEEIDHVIRKKDDKQSVET